MANILLVEPSYRSKFPPLGLMRISSFHKNKGDSVTFVRGLDPKIRDVLWNRVYVSSLFTWELKRTVETLKYYSKCVASSDDVYVGGIGATLIPSYIQNRIKCNIIQGPLDKPNLLGLDTPAISQYIPDYEMIRDIDWKYQPEDSYFCRVTVGCIRNCGFCAVPKLEPNFGYLQDISDQINEVKERFGEKRNLVLLDNNILATPQFERVIKQIRKEGFEKGAKLNGKKRTVDFNQGIDARLITVKRAKLLSSICLSPIRLAFDNSDMEPKYRKAVDILAAEGFVNFTNYVMFNFNDTPSDFYHRLKVNIDLSEEYGIRITGFPMRYIPIDHTNRHYISNNWCWRYLRGIQCVLLATHGVVSPNKDFFETAFGRDYNEFIEILSMPDRYIIERRKYEDDALKWKKEFSKLTNSEKHRLAELLSAMRDKYERKKIIDAAPEFRKLFSHYYPKEIDKSQKRLDGFNEFSQE
jgi:hypothetical protein